MSASRKSRWPTFIIIAAIAGSGGWAYYRWKHGPNSASAGAPELRTNRVSIGNITNLVTANGALNPVRIVTVGSQISGIITEMNVDFNSKVKAGDILAKVDSSTYERDLASADADLANAKAALALAEFNFKRGQELFAAKLISESEYQQNDVALQQAKAVVKTREASVERAKVNLDRTVITAPISGIVISRKVDAGQTVAASFNTPEMFTIAHDLAQMQIETMVSEADVGGIEEGQKVNFTVDAFPNRLFTGRVRQVRYAAVTNQNVVTYSTIVEVENKDMKLRPGMTANTSIITSQRTNVIRIPNAALRFRPPEGLVVGSTNDAVAKAAGTNAPSGPRPMGDLPVPPWVAEGRRPTEDERAKFEATLTPEQKEQYRQMRERMRAMMASGGGPGGGGPGGPGGMMGSSGRAPVNEGPAIRTVYLIDPDQSSPGKPVLKAVSVKTGISDGTNTEISEGLKEGDVIVSGTVTASTAAGPTANPFGGPFGGPPRR
ncbi:MAG TPA: efflux RND transporter periplasmic adaptor subunit [Verrucomicrobiota bacterium]|nr:hypothetical protein [Verrucomicrobiales bacterium]HRI11542.1 efflux RND transporter periplasmic adaptor subunit [Verrucomicrobiota bacterium]